ncbi:MAG TPA: hypothetical protein VFL53_08570 [Pseudolabrys sp.]|nr:hypothetical protein [Pseudolabrys sp.]
MKTARLRTGTLVSLAGLAALIMLSADVRQMHFWSQGTHCDDGDLDGCNAVTEPAPPQPPVAARQSRKPDANGNAAGFVISSRTGARARVGIRYAARFQAYIDDLENNHGARVLFMGGIRPGSCSRSSEHPCGKALDVCQLRRGVVDSRCKLPGRAALGRIAASHGLFEGGRWCNSDYGHAQVDVTRACGESRNRIARKNPVEQGQLAQNMPALGAAY